MLLSFLGTRGTHPSPGQGTMSFILDNKIAFDISPEFVFSNRKFNESWMKTEIKLKHCTANQVSVN